MAHRKAVPIGTRYSRVVVAADGDTVCKPNKDQFVYRWRFRCDCGREFLARPSDVRRPAEQGKVVSCGCYRISLNRSRSISHGLSSSHTWSAWKAMKARCTNPNYAQWKDYGGRGIVFCERWRTFENFLADMGECPAGLTLDRIDNNGDYEPRNCHWATPYQQHRNRRNNKWVELRGQRMTFSDALRVLGANLSTASVRRLRKGLSHQAVIDSYLGG